MIQIDLSFRGDLRFADAERIAETFRIHMETLDPLIRLTFLLVKRVEEDSEKTPSYPEPIICAHCGQDVDPHAAAAHNCPEPEPARALGENSQLEALGENSQLEISRTTTAELDTSYEADARRRSVPEIQMRPAPSPRYARCGNCGERMELSDDPVENHHAAMRHKAVCKEPTAGAWADLDQYIAEFNRQPHVVRQKAEHQQDQKRMEAERAQLAAVDAPQLPQLAAVDVAPVRWWQFWKWFRRVKA